jgi:uncharacterized OB-fold protein
LVDDGDNFSTHGFFQKLSKSGLCAIRCKSCRSYVMPPTSICKNCLSKDLEWIKVSDRGHVVSYSEIHVSNSEFQSSTPYIVAIVETSEGLRLPGIIHATAFVKAQIGSKVRITVEQSEPSYPSRYYFVIDDDDENRA